MESADLTGSPPLPQQTSYDDSSDGRPTHGSASAGAGVATDPIDEPPADPAAPYGRCAHCGDPLPPRLPGVGGRPLKYCPPTPTKKCRISHNNAARAKTERDTVQLRRDSQALAQSAPLQAIAEQLAGYRQMADEAYADLLARNAELEEQVAELTDDNLAVRARADAALREAQGHIDHAVQRAARAERAAAAAEAAAARAERKRGIADGHRQAAERAARRQALLLARERRDHQRSLAAAEAALTSARDRTAHLGRALEDAHQEIRRLHAALTAQQTRAAQESAAAAESQRLQQATIEQLTDSLRQAHQSLAAAQTGQQQAHQEAQLATTRAEQAERRHPARRPARAAAPANTAPALWSINRAKADRKSATPQSHPYGLGEHQ